LLLLLFGSNSITIQSTLRDFEDQDGRNYLASYFIWLWKPFPYSEDRT